MSLLSIGASAIGRLTAVSVLLVVFMFGLAGVVYMSLQGTEIQVPEITGKDLTESEKELALLGLKLKRRAERVSAERPDTIIEQLPKAGEIVKSGQMILVVTSKGGGEPGVPSSLKENTEEEDVEKIEEMISDKPKKPKTNSNSNRKKADTARDVNSDTANLAETASGTEKRPDTDPNKKEPGTGEGGSERPNRNGVPSSTPKPGNIAPRQGQEPKNRVPVRP